MCTYFQVKHAPSVRAASDNKALHVELVPWKASFAELCI